jgi:hypothetical protein
MSAATTDHFDYDLIGSDPNGENVADSTTKPGARGPAERTDQPSTSTPKPATTARTSSR